MYIRVSTVRGHMVQIYLHNAVMYFRLFIECVRVMFIVRHLIRLHRVIIKLLCIHNQQIIMYTYTVVSLLIDNFFWFSGSLC